LKKTLIIAVSVVFVLAFALPVFAQGMTHNVVYEMDGIIDLQKQVGHICNTGAEMKQTIHGEGSMSKVMDTSQVAGKITVSDAQDWVTAPDAVRNLTVTSTIKLCAPAKHVYDADGDAHDGIAIPVSWLYGSKNPAEFEAEGLGFNPDNFEPLTDQVWAVQVEADPGFSGGLTQDFEAAYGPWANHHGWLGDDDEPDDAWWFVDGDGEQVGWEDAFQAVGSGKDYVGNYFNIDQFARTSQGTVRRYIDISSPWSHAYLMEDMSVVGTSEITESFSMDNISPGADAVPDWWDLF